MKVIRCQGEGQGSCKRCSDKGKWNRTWMCFLYKIEGQEGCYCSECVKEMLGQRKEDERMNNNTCCGCIYENIDDTTEDIAKCVCCKRSVEYAKNDYYMRKEDEGK